MCSQCNVTFLELFQLCDVDIVLKRRFKLSRFLQLTNKTVTSQRVNFRMFTVEKPQNLTTLNTFNTKIRTFLAQMSVFNADTQIVSCRKKQRSKKYIFVFTADRFTVVTVLDLHSLYLQKIHKTCRKIITIITTTITSTTSTIIIIRV